MLASMNNTARLATNNTVNPYINNSHTNKSASYVNINIRLITQPVIKKIISSIKNQNLYLIYDLT